MTGGTAEADPRAERPLTVIVPGGTASLGLRNLWRFRDLLWILIQRDLQVRFGETTLGVAWLLVQPALTVGVLSLFFGRLGRLPSEGIPYALYALAGQLAWQIVARTFGPASESLVQEARLVRKVYFPRALLALAQAGSALIEHAIVLGFAIVVFAVAGYPPRPALALAPLAAAIAVAAAVGTGLFVAALAARYRDVRHLVPFATQVWLLASPVAYAGSLVPESWRALHALNPLTGAIDLLRFALLPVAAPRADVVLVSSGTALALLAGGARFFARREHGFADTV